MAFDGSAHWLDFNAGLINKPDFLDFGVSEKKDQVKFDQDQRKVQRETWGDENRSVQLHQEEIISSWIRFLIVLFAIMKNPARYDFKIYPIENLYVAIFICSEPLLKYSFIQHIGLIPMQAL